MSLWHTIFILYTLIQLILSGLLQSRLYSRLIVVIVCLGLAHQGSVEEEDTLNERILQFRQLTSEEK